MDIISAYEQVGTYRGAADLAGTTPKTVKRVVERFEAGGPPGRVGRERNFEVVADLVKEKVESTKGKISAKRLLPLARAAGYEGSARNLRRLVAQAKVDWRTGHHRGRRPAVWAPGEHLVIDWGTEGDLHVFCAVLAWSRVRFVRFATNEKAETTLAMLAECFAELGGVPRVVLADRMGCLKGGVVANVVVPTPDYVRFAGHYGFTPDFCEAADPESKGIVENLVGYSKSDLIVPLLDAHGPDVDLMVANQAARDWCAEVNMAEHSEIVAVPAVRLETERTLLKSLPSLRLELGKQTMRKVDRLSCIRFASGRYSVPMELIGTSVAVRNSGTRIHIIDTTTGEIVADHLVVAPGEVSVLDAHYGGPRLAPARAVRAKTVAEKQFCTLGPVAHAFIKGAAAAGNTRLAGELVELATLQAAHGDEAMIAALDRAVTFGRWHASDVRSILDAGIGTAQPRAAGEALVIDLPVAPARALSAYSAVTISGISS